MQFAKIMQLSNRTRTNNIEGAQYTIGIQHHPFRHISTEAGLKGCNECYRRRPLNGNQDIFSSLHGFLLALPRISKGQGTPMGVKVASTLRKIRPFLHLGTEPYSLYPPQIITPICSSMQKGFIQESIINNNMLNQPSELLRIPHACILGKITAQQSKNCDRQHFVEPRLR